jgi:ParB family transcriptional regulator, chromosome partitioning protein
MTIERLRYEEIDISDQVIDTTKAQARQSNINSNVSDLAATIELQGLFSPVLLVELDGGRYELIAGQRRMKAHREILFKKDPAKFGKIGAFIYRNNMLEWEKKSISINENFNQEPMVEEDKIASVTACYNEFNSIKITSEKTGVPQRLVSKYVKSVRLPKCLKKLKDDGKISLTTALETANIFDLDTPEIGSIPESEITSSALELEKLTTKQKKRVKERIPKEPSKTPGQIIVEVKGKKETTHTITTEVASDSYARIEVFQQKDPKKYSSVSLAASELIDEGLDKNNI